MKNDMNPKMTPTLRLPLQVAPVDRSLAAASCLLSDEGVMASNWLSDIGNFVTHRIVPAVEKYGPLAATIASAL